MTSYSCDTSHEQAALSRAFENATFSDHGKIWRRLVLIRADPIQNTDRAAEAERISWWHATKLSADADGVIRMCIAQILKHLKQIILVLR